MKREFDSANEQTPTTTFECTSTHQPPKESNNNNNTSLTPSPKRKASMAVFEADCLICNDKATGKHYGFFRRTIRKKHAYVCRFNGSCVVDKDMRNSCRSCRFTKCLANGMRPDAVQLERDRLTATIRTQSSPQPTQNQDGQQQNSNSAAQFNGTTNEDAAKITEAEAWLSNLMEAECRMRQRRRSSLITKTPNTFRTAALCDVTESMHQQLILMVEWAKHLNSFRQLPLPSQIGLLRHFAAQHLIICAAFRSMGVKDACGVDAVWLTNESCLPRDAPKIPDVNRVAAHVLDHLTTPMRRLNLEEKEYVALKAVAFFDPLAKDVEESTAEIERTRQRILNAFEYYVTKVSDNREMPHRLANLLLLLPQIVSISRDLVEEAQLAKIFGLANVDELMAELLLPSPYNYGNLKSSVTAPSVTLSNSTATSTQVANGSDLAAAIVTTTKDHHHQHDSLLLSNTVHSHFPATMTIIAPRPVYPPNIPP